MRSESDLIRNFDIISKFQMCESDSHIRKLRLKEGD